jgi:hypothetical protein
MKVNGTIRFLDLETGVWILETDAGQKYVLAGGDRHLKRQGARVECEGDVDADSVTLAMVGPRFVVRAYAFVT